MLLKVNFANPIGPYDLMLNKCAGKYCHAEISLEIDTGLFRVMVETTMVDAYDPAMLQDILNRTKGSGLQTLNVCFYIMFGGIVSLRFLNILSDDPLMRPPELPVYDVIEIPLGDEEFHTIIQYNLKQLGRSYDIPRALFLLTSFTLRLHGEPDKFFCSQLVMYTLREAKIYADQIATLRDINHMTPTNVYDWLSAQKQRGVDSTEDDDTKINGGEEKEPIPAVETPTSATCEMS